MKHTILACALASLPLFAEQNTQSSTIVTNVDGTGTITIDVDGKKETKTFRLGDSRKGEAPAKLEKITYLGVAPGPVSDDLRAQLPLKAGEGIKVNHVAEGSPASSAGIQEHDILLRLNDQILVEPQQLKTLVKMHKPGDEVRITLLRKGEQKELKAVLAETEERPQMENPWEMGRPFKDWKGGSMPFLLQRKGMVIGPDGKSHTFDGGNLDEILDATRKQLEKSGLPKEQLQSILETLENAVKDGKKAFKDIPDPKPDAKPDK